MSFILYYSNFCESSRSLLNELRNSMIQNEIHFMNIDKRFYEKDKKIKILLENGEKVRLPDSVTKVPALLLLNRGNRVIFGSNIMEFLSPKQKEITAVQTNNNLEPMAFSTSEMAGISDCYSYLDMDSDQLSAKGDGGLRTMHSYVPINYQDSIETPPDEYSPDTVGNMSMDQLQQQREKDISIPRS